MGWGDRRRSILRARMTVTRYSLLRWDGEMAICSFSFLFPIFAVVVDFFFRLSLSTFFKTCPFFYYSIFIIINHRLPVTEGELFMNPESRTSKLFRRAELIQTPIIIPAELKSKGEKCSFRSNCLQNALL